MDRLKFYLWNALWSSMIGLAIFVIGILLSIWQYSFDKFLAFFSEALWQRLLGLFYSLLFCMTVGAFIGTVSLFFVFQIFIKLTQKPLIGFISNFLVVAILNILGAIVFGVRDYQQFIESLWFYALIISEVLSFFMIYPWYRRLMFYKEKLELKKASLRN